MELVLRRILALLLAISLLLSPSVWAGGNSNQVQVLATTQSPLLEQEVGTLSFPDGKNILFQGTDPSQKLAIPCSAVTQASFATRSKTLKKVMIPALGAAVFTLGLSLFLLAVRGHGYFLAINYGTEQQAMFSLGKNVYANDVNAVSACTGKPTQFLK
jgi:hypothetical protein